MELAIPTFSWLRDLGCLCTHHASPGKTKGMMALSAEGMMSLQQGKGIVRLLLHYTCSRFETPESLLPNDGVDSTSKRQNWAIVHRLLKEALGYELSWERRELVIAGDIVETLVLLKQIHDLVKPHRKLEKKKAKEHELLSADIHVLEERVMLTKPIVISPKRHPATPVKPKEDYTKPWTVGMKDPDLVEKPMPEKRIKHHKAPLPKFNTKPQVDL